MTKTPRKKTKSKNTGEKNIVNACIKSAAFLVILAIQIVMFWIMCSSSIYIEKYYAYIATIIKAVMIICILYSHGKTEYKISWIIYVGFLPIVAVVLYFLWGRTRIGKKLKEARESAVNSSNHLLPKDQDIIEGLYNDDRHIYRQVQFLRDTTHFPVYNNEGAEYFKIGEEYFERLLLDMKDAKTFILLEYFIIANGNLWNRIHELLLKKAKEGVKVIILVDDWGSITRYPKNFFNEKELGIEVYRYNPISYGISSYINYRDHRKIAVIDGVVAYTGGINIGDEYTNEYVRFGHWKDTGVRVCGKVAQSFMISFLNNLEVASRKNVDYSWYVDRANEMYNLKKLNNAIAKGKGQLMFYIDGPDNETNPAENAYIQMIGMAKEYVYICTPYFVPSSEMLNAILTAARSGLDIRIITPNKPDKWYMQISTRSYYELLLEAGVKVYEYLPGFIHSKSFLCDDELSIVGSINLDFRSLNLNYECALFSYQSELEETIKQDFADTISQSKRILLEDVKKKNTFTRIIEAVINAIAPLL